MKKGARVLFAAAKLMLVQGTVTEYREVLFAQHAGITSRKDLKMNRKKLAAMKGPTLTQTRRKQTKKQSSPNRGI